MLTEPRIVERAAQPYVAIRRRVTIPFGDVVPPIMGELFGAIDASGINPVGPVFFKHNFINMPELELDFAVPVAAPVEGTAPLVGGVLPAGRYAELTHFGHYDGLIDANGALIGWGREQGLRWDAIETPAGDTFAARMEIYPNGPDDEPDPEKWETIVAIKIRE